MTSKPDVPVGEPITKPQTARLVLSWLVVSVPLVYALYQTIRQALPLFGG